MSPLAIPRVYGLTGGIACGKTTFAGLLEKRGWTVVDSDAIAHRLMLPDGENWQKIVDAFGPTILNSDRTINRAALGDAIFREPALREKLNSLTHPAIRKVWQQEREGFLNRHAGDATARLVIVIPLLYEAGLESEFSTRITIGCSAASQVARMRGRSLNEEQIEHRLRSQWPLEDKIKRSDFLIWNDGTLSALERQGLRLP
ncbi:dephospho-CoA kinase [Verrucomicrobium sp. GAS474]|uniref:dephospho-CoA kinase n=1 Tax=Verrucomicrobium sp. GAS474 TaxID=1882831 RepID=UPI00087CDA67|nr:dephospho-CoA kinase [Verrucomicrobium sp. GAS474]SDU09023.1 dephospho-CoA kinase [Verrucomicrobium sp. GAS474]